MRMTIQFTLQPCPAGCNHVRVFDSEFSEDEAVCNLRILGELSDERKDVISRQLIALFSECRDCKPFKVISDAASQIGKEN